MEYFRNIPSILRCYVGLKHVSKTITPLKECDLLCSFLKRHSLVGQILHSDGNKNIFTIRDYMFRIHV